MSLDVSVYLVTEPRADLERVVAAAVAGGVTVVQLRDKAATTAQRRALVERLLPVTRRAGVPLLVDDDLEAAAAADGVHVGVDDVHPVEARQVLGHDAVVGWSVNDVAQLDDDAALAACDYVAVSPVWQTDTKPDHSPPLGLAGVRAAVARLAGRVPVVAIGGIGIDRAATVAAAGADGVAVVSAITRADDPQDAARHLATAVAAGRAVAPGRRVPVMLTIAGSDPSGGAGIQADLKTATALGVQAASVVTALTAQNTIGVQGICRVPPEFVAQQLDSVLSDLDVRAVKIGMLGEPDLVAVVADALEPLGVPVVLDPVMVATSGDRLVPDETLDAIGRRLVPLAAVVTPNVPEAALLTGLPVASVDDLAGAGRALLAAGASAALVKGGHLDGPEAVDVLVTPAGERRLVGPRIATVNTHGTGCTLSSAIASLLALGLSVDEAVTGGRAFLAEALASGAALVHGAGHGPVDHLVRTRAR